MFSQISIDQLKSKDIFMKSVSKEIKLLSVFFVKKIHKTIASKELPFYKNNILNLMDVCACVC